MYIPQRKFDIGDTVSFMASQIGKVHTKREGIVVGMELLPIEKWQYTVRVARESGETLSDDYVAGEGELTFIPPESRFAMWDLVEHLPNVSPSQALGKVWKIIGTEYDRRKAEWIYEIANVDALRFTRENTLHPHKTPKG